ETLGEIDLRLALFPGHGILERLQLSIQDSWDREAAILAIDFVFDIDVLRFENVLHGRREYCEEAIPLCLSVDYLCDGVPLLLVRLLADENLQRPGSFVDCLRPRPDVDDRQAVQRYIAVIALGYLQKDHRPAEPI